jgi:DNA-directed RNA polymerase subunit RPC12/RpoP
MSYYDRKYETTLRDAITAVKNDSRRLALRLLDRCIRQNPSDARPWLWMTELSDDPNEKRQHLESAIAADPNNVSARRGLALLRGQIKAEDLLPMGEGVQSRVSQEPLDASTEESFACTQCGGQTEFNLKTQTLRCTSCGFERQIEAQHVADSAEQSLEFMLPTHRGHRWAEAQHHLSCQKCGADSLWPVAQRTLRCPYCGSGQLIESQETQNLIDPQAIGLMEIDENQALRLATDWLGKGWFSPDDLSDSAQKTALRPAYYPFWTFDGTLELNWHCEVNEGSNDNPRWVSRSGTEYHIFDDMLVSGIKTISQKQVNEISPFKLKEVLEFKPDYIAGWPAVAYDIPLAEATLAARGEVARKVRRTLHRKVLPNRQKRNLNMGGHRWNEMTFKYVLLPLWVGNYPYQDENYPILINGQTGEVNGGKPRDNLKSIALILSILLTIIAVLAGLFILAVDMDWITF